MDVNRGNLPVENYAYFVLIFVSCVGDKHNIKKRTQISYWVIFIFIIIINNRYYAGSIVSMLPSY